MELLHFINQNAVPVFTFILIVIGYIMKRFFNVYLSESMRKTIINIAVGICMEVENHFNNNASQFKGADKKEISKAKLTKAVEIFESTQTSKILKFVEPLFGSIKGLFETVLVNHIQPVLVNKAGKNITGATR